MTRWKAVLLYGLAFACWWPLASKASGEDPPAAPEEEPPAAAVAASGELPSDEALERAGAVIGEIRVDGVDIFDTRIEEENNALYRLANRLHIETRDRTILQQLLVKPGDPYKARLLRESERLLRATGYIREAEIRVVGYSEGRVDLQVTTQDVWTLKPGITFSHKGGSSSSSIGIEETNLFGLGKTLGLDFSSDVDRTSQALLYRDPHLAGSWWALDAQYANNSDGQVQKLALERPFHALDAHWSTGILLSDDKHIDSVYQLGEIVNTYTTAERLATVYGGWSAGLVDGYVTRWSVGFSFRDTQHGPVDQPLPGSTVPPGLRLAYPWLGFAWIEDMYQTSTNLNQIGKTEDIAMGWNVEGRFGLASTSWGSDRDAAVFLAKFSKGWQPTPTQRLLLNGHAEGRIERDGGLAGALFDLTARYYLKQSSWSTFYATATVERGVDLDPDQQILLGGDNGLRGYPLRYQSGNGRWLLTLEQRAYTDWYPFRLFRVGGAVFYDMGRTWDSPPGTSQGLLRDLGFGLRVGNTRSALGTVIHVDLAFPLDGDPSIKKVQFVIEGKSSF
ncbi:MAG TPA: hypothetical protein VHQ87_10675 [Rhizobacter sp.]|nr:hypothetical protein [Rhizobacter sp.]